MKKFTEKTISDKLNTASLKSFKKEKPIDKEGKIIAKNLRGPSLEAKLKELFGS